MKREIFSSLVFILFIYFSNGQDKPLDWNMLMGQDNANYFDITTRIDAYFSSHFEQEDEDNEGHPLSIQNYNRWKLFWSTRVGDGTIQNAGSFMMAAQHGTNLINTPTCASQFQPNWQCLGPEGGQFILSNGLPGFLPNLGKITEIQVDPDNNNTLYIGTDHSGIWWTEHANNAIPDWHSLEDANGLPGYGANNIIVLPKNTITQTKRVYTGTGPAYGVGIMESIDGGQSWSVMQGLPLGHAPIIGILVDDVTI